MRPELIRVFDTPIYSYRTLLAIAFVVCTLLAVRDSKRRRGGIELSPTIGIWALFGALIGARAFYIVQFGSLRDSWRALLVWEGGLVFYGGLAGGVLAVWVHLRMRGTPFLNAADSAAPYLALGEAITRIGCFLNGCCWGAVCRLPWAVTFPRGSPAFRAQLEDHQIAADAPNALPVHPAQLYMAFGLVAAALVLLAMRSRAERAGMVFFSYLLLYGLLRFVVETTRGDSAKSVAGLTVSGAISAALAVAALVLIVMAYARQTKTPPPP